MTTTQSKPQPDDSDIQFVKRVRNLISSRLVETIGVSLLLSLGLFGILGWNMWTIYRGFKGTVTKEFRLQKLSDKTTYLDEVLTMSAYMAASSGNRKWIERYQRYEPELTEVIEELIRIDPAIASDFAQTKTANDKLVEYETGAFELLRQGKKQQADKLLFGSDYAEQKQIYARGVEKTLARLQANVAARLQSYERSLFWSVIAVGASLPLIGLAWLVTLWAVRTYIRERDLAQQGLLSSQSSLRELNTALERQTRLLEVQEQLAKQENEILQADVSNLLEVVSAVEEGDLTAHAPVSDRVTGLVADTFNRLVEQFAQIMAVVSSTAQQVTQSAENLEQLAVQTAHQVRQQTQSVEAVQTPIQNITVLTQNNVQQTQTANESVQQAQDALVRGQGQMTQLTAGIDILDRGTAQIVRRMQTLGDFVRLAVQFAKDQKRIASMTRVLALNAALLSTRATEQQDPEQFASIAREFEAVAAQVNDLAVQTSQSLIVLQQRTDRIQTVVSGLNQDVEEIDRIVKDFATGVGQSRQVFDEIKTTTVQVARVGQQVTQSSQAIADAARDTLKSIQEIATLASDTERQASITREQSEAMGQLARNLDEMVRVFRILPEQMQAASAAKILRSASASDSPGNGTQSEPINNENKKVTSSTMKS
jgi:twitching motility protein PilJ